MKIFENKKILKKIVIIMLCILIFCFCFSGKVQAKSDLGGKLLNPVCDLIVFLGDGIMNVVHSVIYHQDSSTITVDMTSDFLEVLSTVLIGVATALVVGAVVVITGGVVVAAAAAVGLTVTTIGVGTILMVSVSAGVIGAAVYNSNVLPDNIHLPLYQISPDQIFSNKVPLFDVDFFNPKESQSITVGDSIETVQVKEIDKKMDELKKNYGFSSLEKCKKNEANGVVAYQWEYQDKLYELDHNKQAEGWNCSYYNKDGSNVQYIFGGENAWIYETDMVDEQKTVKGQEYEIKSTAKELQSVVSNIYVILRDISLVALLSVLVYLGIRIIMSSTSSDKAKYKQTLIDWIIAICLLFVMQYIMSFSNVFINKITDVLSGIQYHDNIALIQDKNGKIEEKLTAMNIGVSDIKVNIDGENYINWKTNLLGIARLNAQMAKESNVSYAGYTIIFLVLILFTLFFIITYLKRVIYMAFLTLIAPLVALTYPIDKLNDGKAQAFNMWFKEYIFNLLIQPLHLLLYTVFVSSAFELSSNIIYSLVALGFIIPSEKLMRKFFGFEKAHTPGLLAGPAGAAVTMGMVNKLFGKASKGGKASSDKRGNGSNGQDGSKIKYKDDFAADDVLFGGNIQDVDNSGSVNLMGNLNNQGQALNEGNNSADGILQSIGTGVGNHIGEGINYANIGVDNLRNQFNSTTLGQGVSSARNGASNSKVARKIKGSRLINAGKSGMRFYANGMKNKISNKAKNMVRNAPRTVAGLAVGATTASIGLASGIASGDLSKTIQYSTGAALGGYNLGTGAYTGAKDAIHVEGTMENFEEAYYGKDEYKERQIKKNIREYQKDYDVRAELEQKMGSKEAAQNVINNVLPECVRYGITDTKDIAAVAKLEDTGVNRDVAIAVAKNVNENGKNTSRLSHKDSDDLNKTLINRAKKNKNLKTQEEVENVAKNTRNLMDQYSKIRFKD